MKNRILLDAGFIIFLGILILFSGCTNQTNGAMSPVQNINTSSTINSSGKIPTTNLATLKTDASMRVLNYTLRGYNGHIQFRVYGGLNNWLAGEPRYIGYVDKHFVLKSSGNKYQDEALNKLVYKIQYITSVHNDQARIAISLVQHIPYDYTKKYFYHLRYPYQVIYDNTGTSVSKSELLTYLLKKLGFGVALFEFNKEGYITVGIKSIPEYAYRSTGYAFVESSNPTIITDSWDISVNGMKLYSMPEVIKISNGSTFNASIEYHDAVLFRQFYTKKKIDLRQYYEWQKLLNKYGLEIVNNGFNFKLELGDHYFDYIAVPIGISTLHLSINATKPVSVYVVNGSESKIIKTYENYMTLPNFLIQNCKSNNFKKQVTLTCKLDEEYTSSGVLINNIGIGNNTIKINIQLK